MKSSRFFLLIIATTVIVTSHSIHADRFYQGGNCSPQIFGAGSPGFPDGAEGHRVGPLGAEHDQGVGTNLINCPITLEFTDDVKKISFEVYGKKLSKGRARCRAYAGPREADPEFSPWRHMCSDFQGCEQDVTDSNSHNGYIGEASMLIELNLKSPTSPFVVGVQCSLHASATVRYYSMISNVLR